MAQAPLAVMVADTDRWEVMLVGENGLPEERLFADTSEAWQLGKQATLAVWRGALYFGLQVGGKGWVTHRDWCPFCDQPIMLHKLHGRPMPLSCVLTPESWKRPIDSGMLKTIVADPAFFAAVCRGSVPNYSLRLEPDDLGPTLVVQSGGRTVWRAKLDENGGPVGRLVSQAVDGISRAGDVLLSWVDEQLDLRKWLFRAKKGGVR